MQCIYTIGHSTRTADEFIELLHLHNITLLVDIRTIPKSRHNPQFGQEQLTKSLQNADINYYYLQVLGGLRPAVKSSLNNAWHNKSFKNYADYMQTNEFNDGLQQLIELSKKDTVAIMCAEAVPWRCHRSLVSDALLVNNLTVCEIIGAKNVRQHKLTSFAVVKGKLITYPQTAITDKTDDK